MPYLSAFLRKPYVVPRDTRRMENERITGTSKAFLFRYGVLS